MKAYFNNSVFLRSIIIILLLISNLYSRTQSPPSREYQVKAAFLFNFTQFVDWPSASFSSSNDPIIIGILGTNPFGSYLEETIAGEKVNGRTLSVRYFKTIEEVSTCHLLYINLAKSDQVTKVVNGLKNHTTLTVSDHPDFLNLGGMIRFMIQNNKVQLQVNPDAAKAADLTISSKLLRLVEIVKPGK